MNHIRFLPFGQKIAGCALGPACIRSDQDLGLLASGKKLLQLRAHAGALVRRGREEKMRRMGVCLMNLLHSHHWLSGDIQPQLRLPFQKPPRSSIKERKLFISGIQKRDGSPRKN